MPINLDERGVFADRVVGEPPKDLYHPYRHTYQALTLSSERR
jgi:hypothetical protein